MSIERHEAIHCPDCNGTNITSCPGGTCLKPSEWAKKYIKYICMDCLAEFGDGKLPVPPDNDVNFAEGVMTIEGIKPTDPPSRLNTVKPYCAVNKEE